MSGRTFERSTAVTAFTHPIAWFLATLRLWWVSQTQAPGNESADDDASADDLYDERNMSFWYLPPPC
jgi:hypothetical protein